MKFIVLGAGGHGKVVAECCISAGHEIVGFLDDDYSKRRILGLEVIGTLGDAEKFRRGCEALALGIGENVAREHVMQQFVKNGWSFPQIFHSHSWLSSSARVGDGAVVMAGCVVHSEAVIGTGCIINTSASIDHDCVIGDFAHICPGARLAGHVKVGKRALVGVGASVIPQISIGDNAVVGAGAAVVRPVPDDTTVVGVPAKPLGR